MDCLRVGSKDYEWMNITQKYSVKFEGRYYSCIWNCYCAQQVEDKHRWRMQTSKPHDAMEHAHALRERPPDEWEKAIMMWRAMNACYRQNPELKRKLVETGNEFLIGKFEWKNGEFWGWDENKGGKNWAGHLLMILREDFRKELKENA